MERLNRKKCLVCGSEGVPLIRFPKEKEKLCKWLRAIEMMNVLQKHDYNYIIYNARICHKHFANWCWSNTTANSRLIKFAQPCTKDPDLTVQIINKESSHSPDPNSGALEPSSPLSSTSSAKDNIDSEPRERTPKTRKIQALKTLACRLRKKLYSKPTVTLTKFLQDKLTVTQYKFVMSQIRKGHRNPHGRRWDNKEKAFALNIYLQSSSAYRILQKKLAFPSVNTLRRSTEFVGRTAGFCPIIKEILRKKSLMQSQDKLCVLSFDEMAIKRGLTYCEKDDTVFGYETYPDDDKHPGFATHALVMMARGVTQNWKQIIGYFYSTNSMKSSRLQSIIFSGIEMLQCCGFAVVAIVCDQGPSNQALFRELNISSSQPFFHVNSSKVFALYDVPHLLKCTRTTFRKYDVEFQGKVATWKHIVELFKKEEKETYKTAPRLRRAYLEAKGLNAMNVKAAARVLSHSVAAGINAYAGAEKMPAAAAHTAEFVGTLDKLFDSLNGKKLFSEKEYASAVSSTSPHCAFWEEMIEHIKSWKFIGEEKKLQSMPCKKGWLLTISSMMQIWQSLQQKDVKFMLTSRFNQDCLENSFSIIRKRGGFRDNPDAYQFRSAIRGQILHEMVKKSVKTNCEDDDAEVLLDFAANSSSCSIVLPTESQEESSHCFHSVAPIIHYLSVQNVDECNLMEENVLSYIAGAIAKAYVSKVKCHTCETLLVGNKDLEPRTILLYFKEYKETAEGLKWPSDELYNFVKSISDCFKKKIDSVISMTKIGMTLTEELLKLDVELMTNHDHSECAKQFIVVYFVKMMIRHKVKLLNQQQKINFCSVMKKLKKKM